MRSQKPDQKTFTVRKTILAQNQKINLASSVLSQKPPSNDQKSSQNTRKNFYQNPVMDKEQAQQIYHNTHNYEKLQQQNSIQQDHQQQLINELQKKLREQIEINMTQKEIDTQKDNKIKQQDEEIKKLRKDKIQFQNKVLDQSQKIRSLETTLSQQRNQELQEEQKQDNQMRAQQHQEMRHMMAALRMQALEQYQFMFLPEEAFQQQQNQEPDPDNMTYEQLLELQEKIGYVSKGLSKEEIKTIPKTPYRGESGHECTICCSEFEKYQKIKTLRCNHFYHTKCIKQWLQGEKCCPVCKKDVMI